jgi:hypothetical protein
MSKLSGLPTSFALDDSGGSPVTFSNQVATLGLSLVQALQDVSGLDETGTERIGLRGDWSTPISGAGMSPADVIPVFGDVRGSRTLSVTWPGNVIFSGECLISKFEHTVNQDGSWNWTAEVSGSDGIFPVLSLD